MLHSHDDNKIIGAERALSSLIARLKKPLG